MSLIEEKKSKSLIEKIENHLKNQKKSFTWYPDPKKRGTWGFISDCINIGIMLFLLYLAMFHWRPEIKQCDENVVDYYNELNMKQNYYPGWEMNNTLNLTLTDFGGCNCNCTGGENLVG